MRTLAVSQPREFGFGVVEREPGTDKPRMDTCHSDCSRPDSFKQAQVPKTAAEL